MCLETFAAWGLYIIAIVTVVCGMSLTGVGAGLAAGVSEYIEAVFDYLVGDGLDGDLYQAAVIMMTIMGPMLFVSAALGCWGACRRKQFWLLLFNIIAGAILGMVIICGILAAVYQGSFDEQLLQDSFTEQVKSGYGPNPEVTSAWDGMQTNLACCGVNAYTDWETMGSGFLNDTGNLVPSSCCVLYNDGAITEDQYNTCLAIAAETEPDVAILHKEGCVNKLQDDVNESASIIMGTCFSLGLLNLVGVLVGCFLKGRLEGDDA